MQNNNNKIIRSQTCAQAKPKLTRPQLSSLIDWPGSGKILAGFQGLGLVCVGKAEIQKGKNPTEKSERSKQTGLCSATSSSKPKGPKHSVEKQLAKKQQLLAPSDKLPEKFKWIKLVRTNCWYNCGEFIRSETRQEALNKGKEKNQFGKKLLLQ